MYEIFFLLKHYPRIRIINLQVVLLEAAKKPCMPTKLSRNKENTPEIATAIAPAASVERGAFGRRTLIKD